MYCRQTLPHCIHFHNTQIIQIHSPPSLFLHPLPLIKPVKLWRWLLIELGATQVTPIHLTKLFQIRHTSPQSKKIWKAVSHTRLQQLHRLSSSFSVILLSMLSFVGSRFHTNLQAMIFAFMVVVAFQMAAKAWLERPVPARAAIPFAKSFVRLSNREGYTPLFTPVPHINFSFCEGKITKKIIKLDLPRSFHVEKASPPFKLANPAALNPLSHLLYIAILSWAKEKKAWKKIVHCVFSRPLPVPKCRLTPVTKPLFQLFQEPPLFSPFNIGRNLFLPIRAHSPLNSVQPSIDPRRNPVTRLNDSAPETVIPREEVPHLFTEEHSVNFRRSLILNLPSSFGL